MEFNSLPPEVHLAIFSYLSVREVMRIREVCKQWNRLINGEFKFKRLYCCQVDWSEDVEGGFDCYFRSIRCFLRYVSGNLKFNSVRGLGVQFDYSQLQDAFDLVNLFETLVELRCWFSTDEDVIINPEAHHEEHLEATERRQFVVSLDHVKKADFLIESDAIASKVSVLLKMPSLLHLMAEPWQVFTVCYPEKLENLITSRLSRAPLDYSKFTSLRRVYTEIYRQAAYVRSISTSLTERLPSLRELHLVNDSVDLETRYQALDKEWNTTDKATAKISQLRIFYFGFEISANELDGDQLPDSLFSADPQTIQTLTRFIARNLHRSVDRNTCVTNLYYNPMAGELDDSAMFGQMLQKISRISQLRIDGAVADEERLLRFIRKFKIDSLELRSASLSQSFFRKLTANGQRISWLNIETEPTMNILDGDFDFIFQLKKLKTLQFFDCQVPLHFVSRLLRELKRLIHIYFRQPNFIFLLMEAGYVCEKELFLRDEFNRLSYSIASEEAPKFVDELISRLNVDGFACPKKLMVLVRHLELEEQNHRFWMRKYVYEQRHSICLPLQQMRL